MPTAPYPSADLQTLLTDFRGFTHTVKVWMLVQEIDTIFARHGAWVVTDYGLECLTFFYAIEACRLWENEAHWGWNRHMAGKSWVNLADFSAALEAARDHHKSRPGADVTTIPDNAAPFLGLPFAKDYLGGLSTYLRKYASVELRAMSVHIAEAEPLVNDFLAALGLDQLEGPSWAVVEVLPAIKVELERRDRPRREYSANSPISRLKALDLAEVASRYTQLRRVGPVRVKGCCPLHEERTPSFYVFEDSQRWRCFGACATGGDVVDLVRALALREGVK